MLLSFTLFGSNLAEAFVQRCLQSARTIWFTFEQSISRFCITFHVKHSGEVKMIECPIEVIISDSWKKTASIKPDSRHMNRSERTARLGLEQAHASWKSFLSGSWKSLLTTISRKKSKITAKGNFLNVSDRAWQWPWILCSSEAQQSLFLTHESTSPLETTESLFGLNCLHSLVRLQREPFVNPETRKWPWTVLLQSEPISALACTHQLNSLPFEHGADSSIKRRGYKNILIF